jgi:methionine aminotransferase
MIITNNPHNPSGRIWSEADYVQLEKLLDVFPNVLLLSDEVYEYITFENKHISAHHRPKLRDRSVVVSSFGKSFHITGWKVGYLVAPEHLMTEIKKVHQFLVFSVNSVAQYALNEYLDVADINSLGDFYKEKRDYFSELLCGSKFELLPCEGTYFQTAMYDAISQENDIEFSKKLLIDYGVATIPLSPFFASETTLKCIRFCFAKEESTLEKSAILLRKL